MRPTYSRPLSEAEAGGTRTQDAVDKSWNPAEGMESHAQWNKHKRSSLDFSRQLCYTTRINCCLLLVQGIMMTGEACKGINLFNKEGAWETARPAQEHHWVMPFWPAGAKHSEMVLATTKKTWPLRDEQAEEHWGRWWDYLWNATFISTDMLGFWSRGSELWYVGHVSSCILINLPKWAV